MKLATWNVNSIRARLDRLLAFLARHQPDVVCLQELKVTDDEFPYVPIRAAGYHAVFHGQKTYNGVAILSREEPTAVAAGLGDDENDPQARLLAATAGGVRFLCAYVPNGQQVASPAFAYKLRWFERLRAHLDRTYRKDEPLALCGDFNVAPEDRDVHDPKAWENQVLCHPEERARLAAVAAFGLSDAFRLHRPELGLFTWWDYRMLSFPKDRGLRIDHLFVTEPLAGRCHSPVIDRNERKGQKASDHAPVLLELAA